MRTIRLGYMDPGGKTQVITISRQALHQLTHFSIPSVANLKKKKSGMGPPVQVKTPVEASGTRLLKRKRTFSRDRVAAQI